MKYLIVCLVLCYSAVVLNAEDCATYADQSACCEAAAADSCVFAACPSDTGVPACMNNETFINGTLSCGDDICLSVPASPDSPPDVINTSSSTSHPENITANPSQLENATASTSQPDNSAVDNSSQQFGDKKGSTTDGELTSSGPPDIPTGSTSEPTSSSPPEISTGSAGPSTETPIPVTGTSSEGPTQEPISPSVTPSAGPCPAQHFDAASFIGGIVLCGGIIAIVFFGCKFYKSRTEKNYHQF